MKLKQLTNLFATEMTEGNSQMTPLKRSWISQMNKAVVSGVKLRSVLEAIIIYEKKKVKKECLSIILILSFLFRVGKPV